MAWGSDHSAEAVRTTPPDDTAEERERTFACLERCLEACTPSERELILGYYRTGSGSAREQRKQLADRLGKEGAAVARQSPLFPDPAEATSAR